MGVGARDRDLLDPGRSRLVLGRSASAGNGRQPVVRRSWTTSGSDGTGRRPGVPALPRAATPPPAGSSWRTSEPRRELSANLAASVRRGGQDVPPAASRGARRVLGVLPDRL